MNLIRWRMLYFVFSGFLLCISLLSLLFNGLRPAIDFTGGSLWELQGEVVSQATQEELQNIVGDEYVIASLQGTQNQGVILRGETVENEVKVAALEKLLELDPEIEELRFETIGPTFGREVLTKMLIAVVIVTLVITLYVWRQFNELKFGICAVLAMLHDSLILLGSFSIFGWLWGIEVDVLFITAVLTTLSFSVHDTIVVFDRIRELSKKHRKITFPEIVNTAVLETLSRSINNSVTIIIMLLALSLLGGVTIRWFVVALLIGAVVGTYSSTFVAAPLLVAWDEIKVWWKQNTVKD